MEHLGEPGLPLEPRVCPFNAPRRPFLEVHWQSGAVGRLRNGKKSRNLVPPGAMGRAGHWESWGVQGITGCVLVFVGVTFFGLNFSYRRFRPPWGLDTICLSKYGSWGPEDLELGGGGGGGQKGPK